LVFKTYILCDDYYLCRNQRIEKIENRVKKEKPKVQTARSGA